MSEPAGAIHDPLKYAIRWCRAVLWQASRLRAALEQPGLPEDLRPGFFDRVAIEQHFLLIAAAQVLRSLDAWGGDADLPTAVRDRVQLLRHVREHWDEWEVDKRSALEYRRRWPGSSPYTLGRSEAGLTLGGVLSLEELEGLVDRLLDALLAIRRQVGV